MPSKLDNLQKKLNEAKAEYDRAQDAVAALNSESDGSESGSLEHGGFLVSNTDQVNIKEMQNALDKVNSAKKLYEDCLRAFNEQQQAIESLNEELDAIQNTKGKISQKITQEPLEGENHDLSLYRRQYKELEEMYEHISAEKEKLKGGESNANEEVALANETAKKIRDLSQKITETQEVIASTNNEIKTAEHAYAKSTRAVKDYEQSDKGVKALESYQKLKEKSSTLSNTLETFSAEKEILEKELMTLQATPEKKQEQQTEKFKQLQVYREKIDAQLAAREESARKQVEQQAAAEEAAKQKAAEEAARQKAAADAQKDKKVPAPPEEGLDIKVKPGRFDTEGKADPDGAKNFFNTLAEKDGFELTADKKGLLYKGFSNCDVKGDENGNFTFSNPENTEAFKANLKKFLTELAHAAKYPKQPAPPAPQVSSKEIVFEAKGSKEFKKMFDDILEDLKKGEYSNTISDTSKFTPIKSKEDKDKDEPENTVDDTETPKATK